MKILITEMIWPVGLETLRAFATVEYDPSLWTDRELLLKKVQEFDAIVVRNQTKVDRELLEAGNHLKVIGRLGVGLDNIDLTAAKQLEKKVVYGRNANAISVAEYVMQAILEANRPLRLADASVKRGEWDRKHYTGKEIYGKTLGLVGVGEIAHRVAKRAIASGMKVIGYDPFLTTYDFPIAEAGVQLVSFQDLLTTSDFISIHIPLTPTTKGLFSNSQFEQMKRDAFIINTSRGGIINESELYKAASLRQIAGAYLDVVEVEPIVKDHPLLDCENIVITPHIAGLTEESQYRTSKLVAEEVIKVLEGEQALCQVK
ncbi:hydroxyacid dehydrogenase [Alkalihalophilus marmarensis]|uniref:hydroxyacid dehydrogenase n=1 Tax=Alkalihalophilus marmarensis TaxID=521377 RepID=UPI002DC04660|nr:hydroxyacid dehydrogenase [Alkalihalophilus marmarensis]MEC2074126.1 hydroxyacid dehydrogenase [Alkalihalophilus marmarensis]